MIKVYYNQRASINDTPKVNITVSNTYFKAEVNENGEDVGFDVIKRMFPYNSYGLVETTGKVKIYRRVFDSNFKFLDFCRLGYANKMDFNDIAQLYGTRILFQVDTGVISDTEKDIVILAMSVAKDNLTIEADEEVVWEALDFQSYTQDGEPNRYTLWDKYSLTVNGAEYKANMRGEVIEGDFSKAIKADNGIVEVKITKYKGSDFATALTRDIDDEEVFVDTSAGIVDNRRVRLVNGVGTFKLHTLGYTGDIKIKLGRKWYSVWCDYSLKLEG